MIGRVLSLLRFIGLANAAIWFGSAVFFTFAAGPAFFSLEMKGLLGETFFPAYSGAIAMVLVKRYFILQYWCGGIALVHLIAETIYTGRPWDRINASLLLAMLCLSLSGGIWMQPKLRGLHAVKYSRPASELQRATAAVKFRRWHGVSQVVNLLMLSGALAYLWRTARPGALARFASINKFRS